MLNYFFPLLIYIILLKNEKTKAIKINNIFINENNINYNLPRQIQKKLYYQKKLNIH